MWKLKIWMLQILVLVVVSFWLMLISGCYAHFYNHIALFVFGDSAFNGGNNNYINTTRAFQANYLPYGESNLNAPPSGRASNGRLIPDFIAEYANLPLIPTYLDSSHGNNDFVYGANFASIGAGALVETNNGFTVDLKTQLLYFGDLEKHFRLNLGDKKANQLLSNAVYLFSCGGNDYIPDNHSLLDSYTHEQYVEMVIGNLTDVFRGIYEKGGKKIGIINLPLIGCMPGSRAQQKENTCNEELNIISKLHNQKLSNKLQELETQFEGFMYSIFDLNTASNNRMSNPSKYDFKVGDAACCGSGPFRGLYTCGGKAIQDQFEVCENVNEYYYFDGYHITEKANRQYADLSWKGDSNVTMPYNLKTLFQGRNTVLLSSV